MKDSQSGRVLVLNYGEFTVCVEDTEECGIKILAQVRLVRLHQSTANQCH